MCGLYSRAAYDGARTVVNVVVLCLVIPPVLVYFSEYYSLQITYLVTILRSYMRVELETGFPRNDPRAL